MSPDAASPETVPLTPTGDAHAEALRRAFRAQHPRLRDADFTITREGDAWIIVAGAAHFRAVLISPRRAVFVSVDPMHHDTDLAPSDEVTIPPVPEPVAPRRDAETRALIATATAWHDAIRRADRVLADKLRDDAGTEAAEVARFAGYTVPRRNEAGQFIAAEPDLVLLGRAACEIADALTGQNPPGLLVALDAAEAFLTATGPKLATAEAALREAHTGGSRVADLRPLETAEAPRPSATEHAVDALADACRDLRATVRLARERVPLYQMAATRRLRATVTTAYVAHVARSTAVRADCRRRAEAETAPTEGETLALDASARLGLDPATLARLAWPDDPLAAPVLERP